jgi:hypothetical protein
MNRNKLYSLITDAPQVGAQIKIVNSWEHEKAVAFHYELLDILEDIIKNYSKEKLIEAVEANPILKVGLDKMPTSEKEPYWEHIHNITLEEIFFGKYVASFNGKLHFFALRGEDTDVLYVNGLYSRHLSGTGLLKNMIDMFDYSTGKLDVIEKNKHINNFISQNAEMPMWLKDIPEIETIITIPKEFMKAKTAEKKFKV